MKKALMVLLCSLALVGCGAPIHGRVVRRTYSPPRLTYSTWSKCAAYSTRTSYSRTTSGRTVRRRSRTCVRTSTYRIPDTIPARYTITVDNGRATETYSVSSLTYFTHPIGSHY